MTVNRRTVGFNFLEEPELPAPQVSEEQAEQILREHYGLRARAKSLGSQQDRNFTVIVDGRDGAIVGVLKIANPAFNETELQAQDLAADLIAAAEPDLRVAVPLPNVAGEKCTTITGLVDGTAYVRLLHYLPGGTLLDSGYLSPTAAAGLGEVAGRVSRALAGFTPSRVGPDPAMGSTLRRRRCRRTAFTRRRRSAPDRARGGGAGGVVAHRAAGRRPAAAGGAS